MTIKQHTGYVSAISALTETAKAVTIMLDSPLHCLPGSFVNIFMDINGTLVRRSFSVVDTDSAARTITFAARLTPHGCMTPEFWKDTILGRSVRVMGPLGFNTADKFSHRHLYLFAFGIGAGVIKAIAEYASAKATHDTITIMTGSRSVDDIIYKGYFDSLMLSHPHIAVTHILSSPHNTVYPSKGYIQDHIESFSFDDADIFMCGQKKACETLKQQILAQNPQDVSFFVEAFH